MWGIIMENDNNMKKRVYIIEIKFRAKMSKVKLYKFITVIRYTINFTCATDTFSDLFKPLFSLKIQKCFSITIRL